MSEIPRRLFLIAAGALLVAPLVNAQQAARRIRIGVLVVGGEAGRQPLEQVILDGLRDRGYVLGQNLVADFRHSDGNQSQALAALADELIALKPDVLVGTEVTGVVMKSKTSTIPIVLLISADPVNARLVQSLPRPGTNVTGMAGQLHSLVAKQVELLTEIIPKMSRVALLAGPYSPTKDSPYFGKPDPWEEAMREAAEAKGLALVVARAHDSASLHEAFATLRKERPDGLVVATNVMVFKMQREIIDGARALGLPAISGYSDFAANGGLLSYGVDFFKNFRYATKFVDLIVKGAKPADLPVEQVSHFELQINQKTARELGLKIPLSIMLRANRAIE